VSMDTWQERQITSLRQRKAGAIREDAERIQEHIGYVLARLDKGRPDAVSEYAADITAAIGRLSRSAAALAALDEAREILAAEDVRTP
jgi:hypothetical protein